VGIGLVLGLLVTGTAGAQQERGDMDLGQGSTESRKVSPNSGEAIPIGPFLFSPAVQLNWQYRDNIFFTPDNEVADQVWLARARLQFELPIYESYLLFSYTPQYREYKDYELDDKWGHFFDFLGGFEFGNGVKLTTTYKYIQGNLETREIDPGGELYWGDRLFKKHFLGANLDYWVSNTDGLKVTADYTVLDDEDPDLFYDYTRLVAGLGWLHQISEILIMNLSYGHIEFEPEQTLDYRKSSSDEITVGFQGNVNPVVSTQIAIGYRKTSYDVQPGDPDVPDYGGLILNGYINWELAHGSALRLDLLRSDYPSNYGINANYVATGGSLLYQYEKNRVYGQARVRYQVNDYALPDVNTGVDRQDPITTYALGLGYRFGSYVSLWGGYLHENRDSTIYQYSYNYNVYTLGLIVGY
jgi:hypothetical protein